jgi:transcriptional regulator with XRE-family HTH domain
MSHISDNLRILRKIKNVSQEVAADDLGIPRSRFASWEEGRAEPPCAMLISLSDYYHVSIDALLRGNFSRTPPESLMKIGKNRFLLPIMVDRKGNDCIEVVPVKASAGYLNGYADPEFIGKLPLMSLPFAITGKHRSFPIKGDSMPPLKSGDYVIGKYVESVSELVNGRTYILLTREDGIVYKRVQKKNNGLLELHSDNKAYDPYPVKTEDVYEIWEFVCSLNLSDKKEEEINLQSVMGMLRSLQVEMQQIKR